MLPILKKHSWAMRGKQLFSLLLVIALLLGALPLTARPAAAAGVENESSQKDGQTVFTTSSSSSNGVAEPATSHGVYQISFIDDLLWAAGNPDKNYVLTNDIDLSVQTDWIPIGTADAPFSGSFNGAGHTLTLNINQTRPQNGIYLVGLFGYVSGTVVNLTVGGTINATIYSGYVGSVAANIAGGRIINCTSNVDITVQGATGIVHAGGIAGSILNKGNPGGTIANCTNNGTINVTSPTKAANPGGDLGTGTNGSVGGILGLVTTFAKGVVTTSVNNGDITVTNGSNNVGGIVGMTSSSNAATNADITYSANKGNVTIYNIAGERAAGIIGYIKSGRIDYSYNTGNVIAYADGGSTVKNGGNGYYFGILGYANTSNLEIIYSYNASPNPLAAEIGYAKNASNLTFQNFYMAGRSEYGASDPAGTPGTTFNSAADLLTKITVTEDGANAYTSNPEGGYPLLYFEKARTLADQDYDGIIEKESIGNDLNTIYYFVQTDGSVDTQGLTVNAALTKDSTTIIENAALAALPSGDSVRVGDITYVAADGSTLYSVAMNSIPDNLWTEATITAQKDGQTVFTKTITNSNAPTMPGGLPNYPDGTLSKTYNSGPGLANDQYSVTNEDSEMVVVSETSAETFNAYVQSLLSNGFEPIAHTEIDGNIYDSLKQGSQYFYLYYTANSHQARIIQDNSTNTLLSDLDSATIGSGSTEFYLYSIDYANGIGPIDPSKHCDCGALMIVKLADNSLFVIDGGHQNQSSEAAQYGLMKFMYKITGQPYGSKINIRAWFFSHAHGDHVYMAHAFVDAYHDNLNVESVLFNTPSFQTMRSGYDAGTFLMKQSFSTNFPNAKYVKLHTGQHFSLQGVGFDVLHTHEDAVNSSGVTTITDFNDTSTVFKLTMDGKTFLMLGDVNTLVQNDMLQMYSADTLRSDIVQVAHHGYNNLASLYDVVDASLAIVPNSEVGAKDNNPVVYSGYAKPGVAVLFADPDTYKLIVKDGNVEFTAIPSYREDMDLYSVTNVTLNIGSDQTQRNVVWYSDAPTAGKVQLARRSELTG
ncbi:hypothetical protein K0U00_18890, partial [Paenibacillus sepulcri]|nr:hypothetical protein [Paenibacillus sepulcri]